MQTPSADGKPDTQFRAPAWRPEICYLLGHLGAVGCDAGTAAVHNFDWNGVLDTASAHGVLPLLLQSVLAQASPSMPQDVRERARSECSTIAQRNFIFASELLRLTAHLQTNGIPVISYKGVTLARVAYGDVALRQFGDLDIIVRPEHLMQARTLLENQGYALRFVYGWRPRDELSPAQTRRLIHYYHEFEMQRRDGLLIDLHWQLAPRQYPFRLDPQPLWSRLEQVEVLGQQLPSFGREDLLLYLCMHGAKDRWKKLVWIIDLARVVERSPSLDWQIVLERAHAARMERVLWLGMALIEKMFRVELPAAVTAPEDVRIGPLCEDVVASLFTTRDPATRFPVTALHLALCRNFADRFKYATRALFEPRESEWALLRLPSWAYPLYYLIRPSRLLVGWLRKKLNK